MITSGLGDPTASSGVACPNLMRDAVLWTNLVAFVPSWTNGAWVIDHAQDACSLHDCQNDGPQEDLPLEKTAARLPHQGNVYSHRSHPIWNTHLHLFLQVAAGMLPCSSTSAACQALKQSRRT
jgi:hypothetical protein